MTDEMPQQVRDQWDAAHEETHRMLTAQNDLNRRHPDDGIHEVDPDTVSAPWIAGLRDRFTAMLGEPGLKVCPHLDGPGSMPQPVYFRVWKPGLRCIKYCQPPAYAVPAGWPCFRCGQLRQEPTGLYVQTYQLAFIAFYFGLCLECLETTQEEMKKS